MADPEQILWPLRAVSKDLTNLTKLDVDGNVLTSTVDVAAKFVTKAGDTMTGQLIITSGVMPAAGLVYMIGDTPSYTCESFSNTATGGAIFRARRARGTADTPTNVIAGDRVVSISQLAMRQDGTFRNAGGIFMNVVETPLPTDNTIKTEWQLNVCNGANQTTVFYGNATFSRIITPLAINWTTPTHTLEVGGDAMIRGPIEVTGNITSAGTAHSFAANSIPSSAVVGNVPRTIAATGSAGVAGQMVWDDNFLYLHTLSGWKKIPLTAI